jgi:DNA helicase IV
MQCRAVGRRCSTGSVTVLGDIAQGTTPWATDGWHTTLRHLGKPDAHIEELTQGFRVPRQIIDFAARLLPFAAPGLEPPSSVRQTPGSLSTRRASDAMAVDADVVASCREALEFEGSIGLIAADARVDALAAALERAGLAHTVLGRDEPDAELTEEVEAVAEASGVAEALERLADDPLATEERERLTIVPATLAKGLEYDQVLVVEPAEIVAAEPRGLRRLYVVLTRAVSRLVIVHAEPLPEPLLG